MKSSTRADRKFPFARPLAVLVLSCSCLCASAFMGCATETAVPADQMKTLGVMIDVSRGRVLTLPYLKTRFERMAKMGYNAVMLYTEETYKLEDVPKWGYMRGGYTLDDIKEINAMAKANGLELVPCIQTLGHLEKYLRWKDSDPVRCTERTLIIGEEKTYELIDKMLAFWAKGVGGKRIHVGMDEAVGFWDGEYKKRNGERPRFEVFLEHLQRVTAMCKRHGFEEVMIWSDMFYRIGSKTHKYYDLDATPSPDLAKKIPEGVRLVYWDYYHDDKEFYAKMIDGHFALGSEPVLAGGIQTWRHFLHDRDKTIRTSAAFLAAAKEKKCGEMWFTMWGDNGGFCVPDVAEEGLFACAELAAGRTPEPTDENCARFREITGKDYRALARIGQVTDPIAKVGFKTGEGDFFYDDPLYMANLRNSIEKWGAAAGKNLAEWRGKMAAAVNAPDVPAAEAFDRAMLARLDYELAILDAWKSKDRAAIEKAAALLDKAVESMRKFCAIYREDWFATSRPFGFELIQKRNASALVRLEEAQRRLSDYLAGRIPTVEELDETLTPFGAVQPKVVLEW